MSKYNEVLSAYERYQFGKKANMTDIVRGERFDDVQYNWCGIVRRSTLDNGVKYVNCYNYGNSHGISC